MEFNSNWSIAITVVLVASLALGGPAGATGLATAGSADQANGCSFPFSKTDATGTEVTVEAEAESVVTLSPSAAQTMWEIGAKSKVVGVSKFATYLEGASEKTNISGGGYTTVVVEKVVSLDPDIVLAPNVISDEKVQKLREAGLTVYKFREAKSIEDIKKKTILTGKLVGECEGAQETVDWMESELATIREAVSNVEKPRVLYLMAGQWTAGEGTFIHAAIETAGGDNVAANENISGYQQLSSEVVADSDPEWIVMDSYVQGVPENDVFNSTTAVEKGNTLTVNANFISQPAPQIVSVIKQLAKTFHPEAYAEAAATPTPTAKPTPDATDDTATATESPTPTGTAKPTTTETSSPGFTPGIAIVVLLGSLFVLGRRNQ